MASVSIRNVTKAFGESVVIRNFNEEIQDGEFITFLGPSGCGKTTMLRIIAGFEKQTDGEVYIDGQLVSGKKTFVPPEKRGIGMVFQNYAVWPHMTVFENVAYPLTLRKTPKEEIRERVEKALELVHLSGHRDHLPARLSGGQQQRVALARALVAAPGLLLLDEPLSNLDIAHQFEILDLLRRINREQHKTILLVIHDLNMAWQYCDRLLLLHQGGILYQGPTHQGLTPHNIATVFHVQATLTDGTIRLSKE